MSETSMPMWVNRVVAAEVMASLRRELAPLGPTFQVAGSGVRRRAAGDQHRPNSASGREANFYTELSSRISVRSPSLVAAPMEREAEFAIVIMRDLIVEGARFCTALEPFDANMTARSLEQLARLHTSHTTL